MRAAQCACAGVGSFASGAVRLRGRAFRHTPCELVSDQKVCVSAQHARANSGASTSTSASGNSTTVTTTTSHPTATTTIATLTLATIADHTHYHATTFNADVGDGANG